jgi:hypothetical protein
LVAGGGGFANPIASSELYDPASGSWTPTGTMHTARGRHAAALLPDGRVLVAGGERVVPGPCRCEALDYFASAERYDPATGTWTVTGDMTTGRTRATATLLTDGRELVTSGRSAELYDAGPATLQRQIAPKPSD